MVLFFFIFEDKTLAMKKKHLIILTSLISVWAFSQNEVQKQYDFILEDGELIWQHVFESGLERSS